MIPLDFNSFHDGSSGKESACSAGDTGLIPGTGRSPGEGNSKPLQYSCLENSMDRVAWLSVAYEFTKSKTELSNSHFYSTPIFFFF